MAAESSSCCGFSNFFGGGGKKKSKSRDQAPIVKRVSKEHLLSYVSSEETLDKKLGRQAGSKQELPRYRPPPPPDPECEETTNGGSSFDELRASMRQAANSMAKLPLVLPLLNRGVKETNHEFRSQNVDGNKMINEYVWKGKIGTGGYGKVVLYQSQKDEKLYAIKIFHKSRISKLRVSPTETAMMDVLREVAIMKRLDHPNIVKLYEIIDDPQSDNFYMVLEYVEHNRVFEGCGPPGGIGEALARRYFHDIVAGLSYLHGHVKWLLLNSRSYFYNVIHYPMFNFLTVGMCIMLLPDMQNVVHGDIKPENLLLSGEGSIKICDFGVSRMFEGENDELHRSPGTPVFTAPECCSGSYYRGRPADIWALGCTLYCMLFGRYPFMGDGTFPSIYDEIVHQPLFIPEGVNPDLADLLHGLLCKDVTKRLLLTAVTAHPWMNRPFQASGFNTKHSYSTRGLTFENGCMELEDVIK